jgi:glycosidase
LQWSIINESVLQMKFGKLAFVILSALVISIFLVSACKKQGPEIIALVDSNIVVEPEQYEVPFSEVPNTSDIAMYEINERAFSAAGTFAGITARLDSIKALNINVIWLLPIHPIGNLNSINSPYCVKNYFEVNPEYGTLEELRTLVREAHAKRMAVVIDWVANQTSWDNPWIANSSWYVKDAAGTIIHPPGTPWTDVAELDFNNASMRLEMIRAMKYWVLAANIDGYRCHAADFVPFSFWKQANDSLKKITAHKLIMLADGIRGDHFSAGFQLSMGASFYAKAVSVFKFNSPAHGFYPAHQNEYAGVPTGMHKLRFTSNELICANDDTPLGVFGGKQASLAAFVISSLMGGVPLIYNGQEVGCAAKLPLTSKLAINWTTNPDMLSAYKFIMKLRASHEALRFGNLESFSDNDVAAFRRKVANDEVLIVVNTRNHPENYNHPPPLQNTTWTNASNGTTVTFTGPLTLAAFEYRLYIK